MLVLPVPPLFVGKVPVVSPTLPVVATVENPEKSLVSLSPAALKFAVVTAPVNPATDCTGAAAEACEVFT